MHFRLLIIPIFLYFYSVSSLSKETTLDLRDQEWSPGHIQVLKGDWHFYWHQLILPGEFSEDLIQAYNFPVPGAWSSPPKGYQTYPGFGYATYKTTILLPPNQSDLYLSIPDMASAYKLWNNGKLIAENGKVGTTKNTEEPAYLPKNVKISSENGKLELVLHTSNFHYQWGGVWYPLKLTDEFGIKELREKPIIRAMLAATILIAASLFGLFMFFNRPKEKVLLYFSLLCLTMGLRRLLIDERLLYYYVGEHWTLLQALENLTIYLAFPLFISYFSYRFPVKYSHRAILLSWITALPFCSLALTTDVSFYTRFNVPFQMIIMLSVPYIFYIYVKCLMEKRRGAKTFGFGLTLFILTVINDILAYSYLIDTPNLAHLGILAFVIFQGIDLARSYLHNFDTIEKMSKSLQAKNKELMKIDAFKDEFLATTSHELRTPLHGISGLANHLLQDKSLNLNLQNQHKLNLIASTTRRLGSLVNDIVDFSSIKHGNLKLNTKSVDLKALSESVVSTLSPLVEGRDIRLSAEINADAQYVTADENRLQQILFNLLGNAIKFTEEGIIQVNAFKAENEDTVTIEILDTGVGISPDKYDLLFEPFQHFGESKDSLYTGNGLGLSISRQLVHLHGGDLFVDSHVGKGTTIQFSLKIAEPCEQTASAFFKQVHEKPISLSELHAIQNSPPIRQTSWSHDTDDNTEETISTHPEKQTAHIHTRAIENSLIFTVDDEEVNLELVHAQLSSAGYDVRCFSNGGDLLKQLDRQKPDLILLDLMMPTISGLDVCRQIRTDLDSYELPIMMLTARYQLNDIVECLSAGANDYLIKPYHEKELLARVYSQLSARKFWYTHEENQLLKKEIDHRKQLEEALSVANNRLLHALDITDESILLLQEDLALIFANQAAQKCFQLEPENLLGKELSKLVSSETYNEFNTQERNSESAFSFPTNDPKLGGNVTIAVHPFEENAQQYFALVIYQKELQHTTNEKGIFQSLIEGLTKELSASREKFDRIEQALKQISGIEQNAPKLANIDDAQISTNDEQYRRDLLIKLLRETISMWERYTHKTKADLAEESRCWRVYLDGTTAKTRTLDRYLSDRTLPNKPRWQLVIRTAKYVLDNCILRAEDSEALAEMMAALDAAYD